mmetsp:Transcript_3480/g.4084  ORF Transcript_3480/g.4084 Transcript_3480/m.4084 type:complete len:642 (+) Transcript_3480:739-2664(+)
MTVTSTSIATATDTSVSSASRSSSTSFSSASSASITHRHHHHHFIKDIPKAASNSTSSPSVSSSSSFPTMSSSNDNEHEHEHEHDDLHEELHHHQGETTEVETTEVETKNQTQTKSHVDDTTPTTNTTISLISLAATTLAATIIATKTIQQYSIYNDENIKQKHARTTMTSNGSSISSESDHDHRQSHEHEHLHPYRLKEDGTIVTDADGESQRIIASYISNISKDIRIVGEESNEDVKTASQHFQSASTSTSSSASASAQGNTDGSLSSSSIENIILNQCRLELNTRNNNNNNNNNKNKVDDNDNSNSINTSQTKNNDNPIMNIHNLRNQENPNMNMDVAVELDVDPKRVSIYVDPLDGTSAYAKGDYEIVTILIGIMLDNVPIFGIIVCPFGQPGYDMQFQHGHGDDLSSQSLTSHLDLDLNSNHSSSLPLSTSTSKTTVSHSLRSLGFHFPCSAIYGGTLVNGAFVFTGNELHSHHRDHTHTNNPTSAPIIPTQTTDPTKNQNQQQRKAIISKSRGGGVVKQCIQSLSTKNLLHPEPIYITGAGYKTLRLLLSPNNEALWFFPKPGTSLWDVAAADALLRVIGGKITDKNGLMLDYSREWIDADNLDGIVAAREWELHEKCIQLYYEECWDDIVEDIL